MIWQRGRTIMADLQDTNAATEEIYGPLLIVECPVTDEMISQSTGGAVASAGRNSHTPTVFRIVLGTPKCMKDYRNNGVRPRRTPDRMTLLRKTTVQKLLNKNIQISDTTYYTIWDLKKICSISMFQWPQPWTEPVAQGRCSLWQLFLLFWAIICCGDSVWSFILILYIHHQSSRINIPAENKAACHLNT